MVVLASELPSQEYSCLLFWHFQFNTLRYLKARDVNWLHFAIQVQPTFLISDTLSLKCQSARMSEIKNVS